MGTAVTLLGRVTVAGDGERAGPHDLAGAQARITFAALVLERSRALPRHELAELIWRDALPDAWESAVRNIVSRIRTFLAAAGLDPSDVVRSEAGCYRLALPDDAAVDVEVADRLLADAAHGLLARDAPAAAVAAADARRILEEPFLPGIDSPWLDRLRDRLTELRVLATEYEAEARLMLGEARAAVTLAATLVEEAPYREGGHRLLMRALAASGDRGEALRAYERCRRALAEEFGVSPSRETEAAYLDLLGPEPPSPHRETVPWRPTGTVTFVVTEVEDEHESGVDAPEAVDELRRLLHELVQEAAQLHGGIVLPRARAGTSAVFEAAQDALEAVVFLQHSLAGVAWPTPPAHRVKIGVHTGEADPGGDDYGGPALDRAEHVCSSAGGGVALVTDATRLVLDGRLPAGVALRDLGGIPPRAIPARDHVFGLVHAVARDRIAPSAVPPEDGALVGRAEDLRRVEEALTASRLVTVTGLGGVGKTRLALAAARDAEAAGTAVVWVDLAAVDRDGVAGAVAHATGGATPGVAVADATVEALGHGETLLVLDACEHALAGVRQLTAHTLRRCPLLRVLATSRTSLGADGEQVVALDPLAVPAPDAPLHEALAGPAAELFVRRARASSAQFDLTPETVAAIVEICRRLDGLPLALELAAARVRAVGPVALARHLDQRFRILRSRHEAAGRHRSLHEVVEWSHDLLPDAERRVFDRMSAFVGTFDLAAAVAVAGDDGADDIDVLDAIDSLVTRSMLVTVDRPDGAVGYRLLETLRDFGRLALAGRGEEEVLLRHRRHHAGLARVAATGLRGPDEAEVVALVRRSLPDLRIAFSRALAAADLDFCLGVAVDLFDHWFLRVEQDLDSWAHDALQLPGARGHPRYGEAAAAAAYCAWGRGDLRTAAAWAERALGSDAGWLAHAAAGTVAMYRGSIHASISAWDRAAAVATAAGDGSRRALARAQVAFGLGLAGDRGAEAVAREAKALAAASENPTAMATGAWALGMVLSTQDPAAALSELEASLLLARRVDNRVAIGAALVSIAELRAKLTDPALDLAVPIEHLDHWLAVGNVPNLWHSVRRAARTLADRGDHRTAALALGAEAAAALKLPLHRRQRRRHDALTAEVQRALGEVTYRELTALGSTLSPEDVVAAVRSATTSFRPS